MTSWVIIERKALRRGANLAFPRREALRTLKSLVGPKPPPRATVVDPLQENHRILTEYVLNMAVSCLAHTDVTPLYEQYMQDPRLSDEDREELARAFLLLQMASVEPAEPTPESSTSA